MILHEGVKYIRLFQSEREGDKIIWGKYNLLNRDGTKPSVRRDVRAIIIIITTINSPRDNTSAANSPRCDFRGVENSII